MSRDIAALSRSFLLASALAVPALLGASVASAAQTLEGPSASVRFDDLNLATAQGANALLVRLRVAAHTVCDPLDSKNLDLHMQWLRCYHRAVDDAVASVNSPEVNAVYRRGGND